MQALLLIYTKKAMENEKRGNFSSKHSDVSWSERERGRRGERVGER